MKIALAFYWIGTGGLTAIGFLAAFFPVILSKNYGVPLTEPRALTFVRAAGIRDIALAAVLFVLGVGMQQFAMTATSAIVAALALGDFGLSLAANRWRLEVTHFSHLLGVVGFLLIALLLSRAAGT